MVHFQFLQEGLKTAERHPELLPEEPGSYLLILKNPMPQTLQVGSLGAVFFETGWYAYVGSAMGGLSRRVSHYLKIIKRPHWHIDALLPSFRLTAVWVFPSLKRQECRIAYILLRKSGVRPIPGFGCTDCRCISHLFDITGIKKAPLFEDLKGALRCRNARELIYS